MKMLLSQTADEYKGELREFEPFPRAGRPESYKMISPDLKKRILEEGESYLGYQYPSIFATDFMNFKRTGNRVAYEDLYFARRHALCALVTAECMECQGRFMDDIVNGIFVLCEESGWQLPPHNSYHRDKPQLLLPDSARPVLDLFACETGALLACVSHLLGQELDKISPLVTARIQEELHRRIVMPYLEEHFWWMGRGDEPMCNWTAWCTQNVLLTAFLETFDQDLRRRVFRKAALSLDYFLKDYGEDGCCDEGAQYYRHAGLCLCNAMEILNAVSDGAFSPLFDTEKIKNVAAYIMHVHVADKYYFNFSDCSPIAGRAGVQEYLFGKYTRQPELMAFAAQDFRASDGELYSDEVNRINLYHRFQNIIYREEVYSYGQNTQEVVPQSGTAPYRDIFYPSVGLFLTRSSTLSLAVKAGDNADNHNHNDTGSFTLYKNGQPLFVDIGVESYTEKTFSSRRYEIWTMQSGYHNLPTLMGMDQKDGEAYCATGVDTCYGDKASISMELLTAYPIPQPTNTDTAPLTYRRCVTLDKKQGKVVVKDTTNLSDVILNFITYEKPVFNEGVLQIGSLASVAFTGACPLTCPVDYPESCSGAGPGAQPGALFSAQPDAQPGALFSAQPGAQPGALFSAQSGAQPGALFSAQPDAQPGVLFSAPPGAQPGALFSAPPGAQPGALFSAQSGAQPGALFSAQSGAQPGALFSAQPGAQAGALLSTQPDAQPGTRLPDSSSAIEVLPVTDRRLKKTWDHDLYRVRLRMTGSVFIMEIR